LAREEKELGKRKENERSESVKEVYWGLGGGYKNRKVVSWRGAMREKRESRSKGIGAR